MNKPVIRVLAAVLVGSLLLRPAVGTSGSVARARATETRAEAAVTGLPVPFPGPERGVPATQSPGPTDFLPFGRSCNATVNDTAVSVDGEPLPAGTAVLSSGTCPHDVTLFLDAPGPGRFQLMFAVVDNDETNGAGILHVHVIGPGGYERQVLYVTAHRGDAPHLVDVDVTDAVAVVLDEFGGASTALYHAALSGAARALRPMAGNGSVLPAGATPLDMAAVAKRLPNCAASAPLTVTLVRVPAARAWVFGICTITVPLTPSRGGTLVLRYGSEDSYDGYRAADHRTLYVQVFDAAGRLLREASGPAFAGGGLRPLWIDLRGGSKLTLSASGSANDGELIVTAAGILPGRLPVYTPPLPRIVGGPGAGVPIDPAAFIPGCVGSVGGSDQGVAGTTMPGYTYLIGGSGCTAKLILDPNGQWNYVDPMIRPNGANGRFHARFGLSDAEAPGAQATVTVAAYDRAGDVLSQRTFRALRGVAGVSIDVQVDRASVLSFTIGGSSSLTAALLYDLRLSGPATVYGQVYPPTEPPVTVPGGVAINPRDFTAPFDAGPSVYDDLLVRDAALAGWALSSAGGVATLEFSTRGYPRHLFSARIGIGAATPPYTTAQVRLTVLDSAGHVLRQRTQTAWYAHGPQDVQISLSGGSTLQIQRIAVTPAFIPVDVYAMTAS